MIDHRSYNHGYNLRNRSYNHGYNHHNIPRVYYELTSDQLPVGLIAQLVIALHRHPRRHGFESRQSLKFFQTFFPQLFKLSR